MDNMKEKNIDFTNGLPALIIPSEQINNKTRDGLLLYLGHNLQVNDTVRITIDETGYTGYRDYCFDINTGAYIYMPAGSSLYETQSSNPNQFALVRTDGVVISEEVTKPNFVNTHTGGPVYTSKSDTRYRNGVYRVTYIKGNKVYFQLIKLNKPIYNERLPETPIGISMASISGIELGIPQSDFAILTGRTDVNWLAVYAPAIFVQKIVDHLPCKYYLKRAYYLNTIDDIYNCGFSNNAYNQPQYLFTEEKKLDLYSISSNLGEPITEVYAVSVKNANNIKNMTTVQSTFSNFVTSTFDYCGIQTVSRNSAVIGGSDINYSDARNFLHHSLVEYNPMSLQEIVINPIEHTFICAENVVRTEQIIPNYDNNKFYSSGYLVLYGKHIYRYIYIGFPVKSIPPTFVLYWELADGFSVPESVPEYRATIKYHTGDFVRDSNYIYLHIYPKLSPTGIPLNAEAYWQKVGVITGKNNSTRFAFNPFYTIPIRKFSNTISESDSSENVPTYALYDIAYQKYRWRAVLDIGYYEAQRNGIDFPYLNDAFYIHSDILLHVRNYSSPKISPMLTGGYLISTYTEPITQEEIVNTTGIDAIDDSLLYDNKYDKPFEVYTGGIC